LVLLASSERARILTNSLLTADAASLDSDDLDDEKPAPKTVPRKRAAAAPKATTSKRSSKASTPAKSTTSSRAKGKQKAKIEYLSDEGDEDFVEDEVSEYEDFEGDDDNVSVSCLVYVGCALILSRSCMNQTRIMFRIIP
jgi:hypothetical protein